MGAAPKLQFRDHDGGRMRPGIRAVVVATLFGIVLAALLPPASGAATHVVELSGVSFKAEHGGKAGELRIAPGDSVRFVNKDLPGTCHTVTRGSNAANTQCSEAGGSTAEGDFDILLDGGSEAVVNFNTTGVVSLYCRPHNAAGMKFRIIVSSAAVTPDPDGGAATLDLGLVILAVLLVALAGMALWRRPAK